MVNKHYVVSVVLYEYDYTKNRRAGWNLCQNLQYHHYDYMA